LNNSTIDTYAEELKIWGNSLSADGDILLFGCYVAANEGSAFVSRLADLTDADIAASEDLTGSALSGGDWDLEKSTGSIEATIFNNLSTLASYEGTLAIAINGSTADWDVVLKGSKFDNADDQQSPQTDLDLVGNSTHALLYMKFDEKDAGTADDEIGFRVRVTGSKSSTSSSFSSGYIFTGVDSDLDGDLDFFISISTKNNSGIQVWSPGTGANNSPSTTTITSGVQIVSEDDFDSTNYSFTPVSSTTDPSAVNNDMKTSSNLSLSGNYDEVDHFLSFKFSFASLVTALGNKLITIDKDTTLQYTLATSTQSNSFNSDIGGYSKTDDTSTTYAAQGAFSAKASYSNAPPEITSNGGGATASVNVVQNTTTVTTPTATDPNSDTVTFTVNGGADAAKFEIVSGVLKFKTAPTQNSGSAASSDVYTVEVQASDGTDTDTQTLTVTVTGSNSAPTLTDSTINGTEDTTITFTAANFTGKFTDSDNDSLGKIKITSLPANGTLKLSGTAVSVNDEVTAANLPNLTFVPNANWNGSTTLNWKGHDGTVYSTSAATMTLSISAVNDLPTLTNSTKNGNQDTTLTFTSANFTDKYSDTESSSLTKIQITAIPSNGTLKLSGTAISVNDEITAANLANITFVPNASWNGSTTLSWKGHDGTAYASSAATMTLDIAAATTTTTTEEAPLTLLSTNPKTTTTNPAAGAGKSDENNNTISGT
ncbi:MAG: DUF4347 domain-containing protein, partial [Chloroflexi bacterium]|nr:DUF4347 domain-containing protein [Chloroflexota bacterium]